MTLLHPIEGWQGHFFLQFYDNTPMEQKLSEKRFRILHFVLHFVPLVRVE